MRLRRQKVSVVSIVCLFVLFFGLIFSAHGLGFAQSWFSDLGGSLRRAPLDGSISPVPSATPPRPPHTIALGAYISGAPWNPAKIDEFSKMVDAMPAVVMWYQDWVHPDTSSFRPDLMQAVVERGAMPMVTWEPWDYTGGAGQTNYSLRTIVAGQYDGYIRQWAKAAALWGKPFYLRFAQEMNGGWYPWGRGVNSNSASDFVAVWRHVVDIFRQEGATNVRWVWSPNVLSSGTSSFADLYPGDNYVDWVGLDGYNEGTGKPASRWKELPDLFGPSYDELAAMTSKPMMIAETASVEGGGDKARWIEQGLIHDLPSRFPRVQALIWFNEHLQPTLDWRVNSSSASLFAFRVVAATSLYHGRLP